MKSRIAVIPGDPSGIGPELIAKLTVAKGIRDRADILLIGDRHVLMLGADQAGITLKLDECNPRVDDWTRATDIAWYSAKSIRADDVEIGQATRASGQSVLTTLDIGLELLQGDIVNGLIFGPFNKEAMHMAGLGHADELHYMADKLNVEGYITELNTLDGIWTSRVTSHIPLRDVSESVTEEGICEAVLLLHRTLKRAGINRPQIAVAGLNPHAGDGGNFGDEEIDIIAPAITKLKDMQLSVLGPFPSDTIFLKARAGEVNGVVTMYHDQGQIALKLMGFDRGVTVHGGLPFPITTPAHGSAFDIAGLGKADCGATTAAFEVACDLISSAI